jgi:two-component system sensor histidine kinase DesK
MSAIREARMQMQRAAVSDYEELMGRPWVGLAYLVFAFLPLLFWEERPAHAVLLTLLAAAVFLPLYFAFYRVSSPRQQLIIPAVAALGLSLAVVNPGGNTFIIYAAAMAGTALPLRHALLATAGMLVGIAAVYFLVLPFTFAIAYTAMVVVISTLVLAGVLVGRARQRRNAELRLTQDEVARLAAMAERERIGRDLHDLLGHTLSLVAIKSELAGRLVDRDPEAAKRQIGEVETVARQALAQVREAVVGIRATGLQAELAASRLALLSADVRMDQRVAPMVLPAPLESALAMAVREATTNVLRHASAGRVEVELASDAGELRLQISDDGKGGIVRHGNGLTGMRERLQAAGARLDIDSPPGGGTRLLVTVPRAELEAPAP